MNTLPCNIQILTWYPFLELKQWLLVLFLHLGCESLENDRNITDMAAF